MARIELLMSVLAGISGGMAGLVWSRVVSAAWLARAAGISAVSREVESASRQVAAAVLFATGGAVLGFLFWLSWGLISVVGASWYSVGILYGTLAWAGVALPLLGVLALRQRSLGHAALVIAVEWFVTCVAIGLSCALAWHRYA
jgi:hypothetical protein